MATLKTRPTGEAVAEHLAAIEDPARRRDCQLLRKLMTEVSGREPAMWAGGIVGFGSYNYRYASGRSGTWFRVGFASRKKALTIYLSLDLDGEARRLASLGRHTRGKGCLYLRSLSQVNQTALRELVAESCARPCWER